MLALVRRGDVRDERGANWFHPGDIVWRLFQNTTIVPEDTVRLVRGAPGDLAAIIWLWPPAGVGLFVPPDTPSFAAIARFAIREAEEMLQPGDRPYFCNVQSLAGVDVPPPSRAVRPVNARSDRELDARVARHRVVWEPSKFTREGYDRLRTKPVGAAPRFRRQGYVSSVMFEGLRRLQALGTTRAVVLSAADPEGAPANALYRATGCAPRFSLVEWTKPPAPGSDEGATTPGT